MRNAEALDEGAELTGTVGAVLDPIFSLRVRVRIPPGASAHVAFTTFVTEQKERAIELAGSLSRSVQRAARARSVVGAGAGGAARSGNRAGGCGAVSGSRRPPDVPASGIPRPRRARSRRTGSANRRYGRLGISGDWPILLATIESAVGMPSVRQLLQDAPLLEAQGNHVRSRDSQRASRDVHAGAERRASGDDDGVERSRTARPSGRRIHAARGSAEARKRSRCSRRWRASR